MGERQTHIKDRKGSARKTPQGGAAGAEGGTLTHDQLVTGMLVPGTSWPPA